MLVAKALANPSTAARSFQGIRSSQWLVFIAKKSDHSHMY